MYNSRRRRSIPTTNNQINIDKISRAKIAPITKHYNEKLFEGTDENYNYMAIEDVKDNNITKRNRVLTKYENRNPLQSGNIALYDIRQNDPNLEYANNKLQEDMIKKSRDKVDSKWNGLFNDYRGVKHTSDVVYGYNPALPKSETNKPNKPNSNIYRNHNNDDKVLYTDSGRAFVEDNPIIVDDRIIQQNAYNYQDRPYSTESEKVMTAYNLQRDKHIQERTQRQIDSDRRFKREGLPFDRYNQGRRKGSNTPNTYYSGLTNNKERYAHQNVSTIINDRIMTKPSSSKIIDAVDEKYEAETRYNTDADDRYKYGENKTNNYIDYIYPTIAESVYSRHHEDEDTREFINDNDILNQTQVSNHLVRNMKRDKRFNEQLQTNNHIMVHNRGSVKDYYDDPNNSITAFVNTSYKNDVVSRNTVYKFGDKYLQLTQNNRLFDDKSNDEILVTEIPISKLPIETRKRLISDERINVQNGQIMPLFYDEFKDIDDYVVANPDKTSRVTIDELFKRYRFDNSVKSILEKDIYEIDSFVDNNIYDKLSENIRQRIVTDKEGRLARDPLDDYSIVYDDIIETQNREKRKEEFNQSKRSYGYTPKMFNNSSNKSSFYVGFNNK